MELTQNEIKILLRPTLPTDLFDKLTEELKRLEKKQEREEREVKYAEIVIYELKKKYPQQLKDVTYYRDGDFGLVIVIDDHDLYYSKEFTEFIGYLDMKYLFPNEVWIAFIVKY